MIREATFDDIKKLVDLAQELVTESPVFNIEEFCRLKTFDFLAGLLTSSGGILLVAERDGTIVGAMAGGVSEHPFGYTKFAFDYGLFVSPRVRGGIAAAALVRAFEAKAASLGAKDFRPGIMTAIHVSRTTRLYERLGYMRTGTQLIKRFF